MTPRPLTMAADRTSAQNHVARATSLVTRARRLRGAQAEVQEMTAHEVQVMARTAASFFEAMPLTEFSPTLFPPTARTVRRIRHRILHHSVQETDESVLVRALLLGRDGVLRLFTARSSETADLIALLEPGRMAGGGVLRDVVEWSPAMRVPGFRPFEILDKLSTSLDVVDEQLTVAEERVQVQKAALASGNLAALLPGAALSARVRNDTATATLERGTPIPDAPPLPPGLDLTDETALVGALDAEMPEAVPERRGPVAMGAPAASVAVPEAFDLFRKVQAVAASVAPAPVSTPASARFMMDDEPSEWDDPI